jgi:hypothetical protein
MTESDEKTSSDEICAYVSRIGSLNERSLHADIKRWYSKPGDQFEVKVDNYVVDIVRDDFLIEIQTRNFSAIRLKLLKLVESHKLRLVYPISVLKWVIRMSSDGSEEIGRRRSPRKGKLINLFDEMLRMPFMFNSSNFELEVLMTEEEEIRHMDGLGSWRKKGASVVDRKLIEVRESFLFSNKADFLRFIPDGIESPFTNKSLAQALGVPARTAQKVTYTLKHMGVIEQIGKEGSAFKYEINNNIK